MTTQLSSQVRVVPEARFELTRPESKSGALPTRLFGSMLVPCEGIEPTRTNMIPVLQTSASP